MERSHKIFLFVGITVDRTGNILSYFFSSASCLFASHLQMMFISEPLFWQDVSKVYSLRGFLG